MAMTDEGGTRALFNEACRIVGKPFPEMRIGELGNQRIKTYTDTDSMDRAQSAKSLLEWLGAKHLSLDTNGRDGSTFQDLSRELDPKTAAEWAGLCDLVTNCGTSEHVMQARRQPSGQYWCFRTVHELCKAGGIMAHGVPQSGSCRKHGHWKYTAPWFHKLATDNGYLPLYVYERDNHNARPAIPKGAEVYQFAILRKADDRPFQSIETWQDPPRE